MPAGTGDQVPGDTSVGAEDPLILNLSGGQVHTANATTSGATFDMFGSGAKIATGWTTTGEGFLVLSSSDGTVSSAQNFVPSFSALAQYDLNHDGVINSSDAIYSQLRVWVNTAGDGVFHAADSHSLSELGIASINLDATVSPRYDNGNMIMGDGSFTYADGATGDIAQAALLNGDAAAAVTITADSNSLTVGGGAGMATQYILGTGQAEKLANNGTSLFVDLGGNNTIDASGLSGGIVVVNNGSSIDLSGASNLTVIAGGNVQIIGGAGGNNTIYIEGDSSGFTAGTGGVTLTVDGNGSVISTAAQNTGQAVSVINGDNNFLTAGALSQVTEAGSGNTVVAGAGSNITMSGSNNAAISGTTAYITEGGTDNAVQADAGANITVTGSNDTAVAGTTAYVVENGTGNAVNVGTGSNVTIGGSGNTAVTGTTTYVVENGTGNAVNAGAGSNVTVGGSGNTAVTGTTAYVVEDGTGNAVNAGAGSTVTVIGGDNTAVTGTTAYVVEGGSNNAVDAGAGSTVVMNGTADTAEVGTTATYIIGGSGNLAALATGAMVFFSTLGGSTLAGTTGQFLNDTINQFSAGNAIDVTDLIPDGSAFAMAYAGTTSGGQLSLTDGNHATRFSFVGSYVSDQFHVASDGYGGTVLTYRVKGRLARSDRAARRTQLAPPAQRIDHRFRRGGAAGARATKQKGSGVS